jgi:tRNA pseudouridine55 synthase
VTSGFLAVDKPSGLTSHDVVAQVRRVTGIRKAGHTGTLDPMATGVVVVAVGGVTRLIRFLQDLDKEYVATAMFGVATDSLDADGNETARQPMSFDRADLEAIVPNFLGEISQVPPMVSALKKDGARLYDLARQGIEVDREARPVTIHELEIQDVTGGPHPLVTFRVVCGKGTYVRSLADDLAAALGGFAHLTALRRTRNGPMVVADAVTIERLGEWESRLVAPADAMAFLPRLEVDDPSAGFVRNGRALEAPGLPDGLVAVTSGATLLAVYRNDRGTARPEVVLS